MTVRLLAALAAFLLTLSAPAHAEWLRAESANFVVYGEGGEERLRTQVAELQDFHQLLRQLTGTADDPAAAKLEIYIVRGGEELRQIWPGADDIAGFYAASTQGIVAVVDATAGRGWVGRNEVLFHEYAHHFMLQHFPAVYPQWYIEGFAEYLATARFEGDLIEYGRMNAARASWIGDTTGWLPLDQLLFTNPERIDRSSAQYYAQAWLLVHYLLRDAQRMRQLNSYLTAVNRGQEPRAAFQSAFGMTAYQMQRQLRSYAIGDMSFTRVRRSNASAPHRISVSPMPRSVGTLLHVEAAMKSGPARARGEALVRRARRGAEGASDPFSRRVLARAEALHGDGAAAERLLDALLEASPQDAELLYLMGMRHLTAGRADAANRAAHFRRAQGWFARAHRADENHYPTLFHYAESLSSDPAALLSENTTNILLLAQQLAPQAHSIRLSTANLLMRRERWAEAEAMLIPLASHPHAGVETRTARELLEKARARDNRNLPEVFKIAGDDD